MMKFKTALVLSVCMFMASAVHAAISWQDRDDDGDGYKESKVYSDKNEVVKVLVDSNKDKKYDSTFYFKKGVPSSAERDSDYNGKADTWIQYDASGEAAMVATDKRADGKPDYWRFLRKGSIYRREFDRNFDGKPDLKIMENDGRLVEKHYDNDFDGKFEKIEKAPEKGSTGLIRTVAPRS